MDLANMSVEDFMSKSWDSDENESEDRKTGDNKTKSRRKKKDDTPKRLSQLTKAIDSTEEVSNKSSHQKQLDELKQKDPEFYEFLRQEDNALLHFDNGFDLDDSSDDDEEVHTLPDQLQEASDSDVASDVESTLSENDGDMELISDGPKQKHGGKMTVTSGMIDDWKMELLKSRPSLTALKDVIKAFHAAVARFSDDNSQKSNNSKSQTKFKVESGGTFNAVVGLCIKQMVPSLAKFLDYRPDKSAKRHRIPSHCKSWAKVRGIVQLYLSDIIALNQLLLEPTVVCSALRHTVLLVPYFVSFPKIAKCLIKYLVRSWSCADDESVRVLTFLCINRIIKLDRKKYLEPLLRQCYLAYVANCKFTTPSTLPMVNFMQQTLSELFAVNPTVTYQLAFLYIRQLSIHLRKAMTVPKKEYYQAVYNWQYVHCIGLWCRVVGNLYSEDVLKPLLYPLVQVSLGTIALVPTARYFPLRYHIIQYLTMLSSHTSTYIPLLPYIMKPLKLADFSKKKGGVITEPLQFCTILKLSNSQLKESSYRSSTMDEMYHALMEYINSEAHCISFPEMTVPATMCLKKYLKTCKMPNYAKLVRQIVEKIEENSKFVLDKRSEVSFGVADVEAVESWQRLMKENGVPFHKHYQRYKKLRQTEKQHAAADKNRNVEERLPTIDRKKFMDLAKEKDRNEYFELFGNEDAAEFEVDFEKTIKETAAKPSSVYGAKSEACLENERPDEEFEKEVESLTRTSDPASRKRNLLDVAAPASVKLRRCNDDDEDDEPDVVEDFQFSSEED